MSWEECARHRAIPKKTAWASIGEHWRNARLLKAFSANQHNSLAYECEPMRDGGSYPHTFCLLLAWRTKLA
jgi:hypothetical protein